MQAYSKFENNNFSLDFKEIRPKKIEVNKKVEEEKPALKLEIGKKPGYRRNRQVIIQFLLINE